MRPTGWMLSLCMLMVLACCARGAWATPVQTTTHVQLSRPLVELTGPWHFSTGDDPRWAASDFDDSRWESVDLSPAPGAHDGDVGLPGYVPGWSQRGHAGYSGFAWYRLKISIDDDAGAPLALAGPTLVDSTYQVYVDGKLLGGPGVFSGATPVAYSVRPTVFRLPAASSPGPRTHLIAFRVWMDPLDRGIETGGIHIAPTLGTAEAIGLLHQVQWLRTFKGYVVDAVEPVAFLLLAVMVLALAACRTAKSYAWMVIALVLLALLRLNQVTYAWTPFQSLRGYDFATAVVLRPLVLAAWTLAWRDWFGLARSHWLSIAIGVLAVVHVAVALAGRPWLMPEGSEGIRAGADFAVKFVRLAHAALYLAVIALGIQQAKAAAVPAALAALLVGVGLFAPELNALGIPGIWFPYGTGVARGQYAYAAFVVLMFGLVLVRATVARLPRTARAAG